MIASLRIINFRSISDSGELTFSGLNVLVGPNNSGKSSVLAVLLLLKQTLLDKDTATALVTSGPVIDLGSYLDIVRDASKPLEIGFRLSSAAGLAPPPFIGEVEGPWWPKAIDEYRLSFSYSRTENEIFVNSFSMKDTKSNVRVSGTRAGGNWTLEGFPPEFSKHLQISFQHFIPMFIPVWDSKPDEKLMDMLSKVQISSQMNGYLVGNLFTKLSYVGPIRERIPRYAVLGTMPSSEIMPSGQNLMRALSSQGKKGASAAIIKKLNEWLGTKLKMLRNVQMKNIDPGGTVRALIAKDRHSGASINLAATGAGISQIIPVVVQTVLTQIGGLLIVEQPEIHLHPAAQTDLADLFIENLDGKQYLIETHSEHFVLRLRRRIAEGKLSANFANLFMVEKKEGATKIRQLALKSNGEFVEWPEGFFDEGYREALALAMASHKTTKHAH